jgi:hypothetical protein
MRRKDDGCHPRFARGEVFVNTVLVILGSPGVRFQGFPLGPGEWSKPPHRLPGVRAWLCPASDGQAPFVGMLLAEWAQQTKVPPYFPGKRT